MKRLSSFLLAALLAACGEATQKRLPGTGGEGGEGGEGGDSGQAGRGGSAGSAGRGGSGGRGGMGGSTSQPDAMIEPDAGATADVAPAGDAPPSASGCAAAGPMSLLCDTLRPLPKTIKETGLFPMAPALNKPAPGMREYVPDPALWSNGLDKQRFVILPQGTKIDNATRRWGFPIGTVMVKTFFDDGGAGGAKRAVETRLIRRIAGPDSFAEYDYAVYQWAADGRDATLVDIEKGRTPVMVTVKALNGGQPFSHDIPSRMDCLDCHEKNGKVAQTFIGFDDTRLDGKLDELAAAGLFTGAVTRPPAITDPDPRLQRVKRFVFGNCVHCHNGDRIVDLQPSKLIENTVGKPVTASGVTPPAGWLRVVRGKPDMSVLYVETRRTQLPTGLKPMPPVGVALPQPDALDDLRAWIMNLPPM